MPTDIVLDEETVQILADDTVQIAAQGMPGAGKGTVEIAADEYVDVSAIKRVFLRAPAIRATASDFMLDQPLRRTSDRGLRRALVHDQRDGLTVNYNGDYPGGVTIVGNVTIRGLLHVEVPGLVGPVDVVRHLWDENGVPVWKPSPMVADETRELDRLRQRVDDLEAELRRSRHVLPHPLARLRRVIIAMWRAPIGRAAG